MLLFLFAYMEVDSIGRGLHSSIAECVFRNLKIEFIFGIRVIKLQRLWDSCIMNIFGIER